MIITLKNADFSASNIGTVSTWSVTRSLGLGAVYTGPIYVKRGDPLSATVTLNTGYELVESGISITMSDIVQSGVYSVSGNVISITIPSVTGNVNISVATRNITTGEEEIIPPTPGQVVALTADNKIYSDPENHLDATQISGMPLVKSNVGTKGIYAWDIPKYAEVSLTMSGGGNYGMALTDANDIVIEGCKNSDVASSAEVTGTYVFSPTVAWSKLYVSTTKFKSAVYRILSEEEIANFDYPIPVTLQADNTKYIATSQTVGQQVKLADMSSTGYYISSLLPANSIIKIKVKTGGSYGMVLADANGNVLESKPSNQADADGYITFTPQVVPTMLYASKTKYISGTYKVGG